MDLRGGVGGEELAGEVGEVGEGELARVGALADGEEDDVGVDEVVDGVAARFDGGLGLRVAGELAEDLLGLLLDFFEGGAVGLFGGVGSVRYLVSRVGGRSVGPARADGGAEGMSIPRPLPAHD